MNKLNNFVLKPLTLILNHWQYFVIVILSFFVFRNCRDLNKKQIAKIIVPEVVGKFDSKKPLNTPIVIKNNKEANNKKVYIENKINPKLLAENEKLKQDFAKEKDSLKRIIAYNKSIQLNKFSSDFEDENIVINIEGIVQGEVKEITPEYKIKERKVEVPIKVKETLFRLLAGLEVGNNTKLDGFKAKANLMLQNRKGDIISSSFDTNQTIWVGYNFSIFNIKK